MRDTTNVLLGCDLRQAEVAVLVRILQDEDPQLLVKLVKGAIVREIEDAVDPEGLFLVATPNVFVVMSFFIIAARPLYTAIQPVLDDLVNNQESLANGFPAEFASAFLASIVKAAPSAPSTVTEICAFLYEQLSKKFPDIIRAKAAESFIIFRGFANILLKPHIYGLVPADFLKRKAKQALVDISKALTYLAEGRKSDELESNDPALLEFVSSQNINTMRAYLTRLVNMKSESGIPTVKTSQTTINEFCVFLEKILVRVDAGGLNRNERVHSLIIELHDAVESSGKLDVDIHREEAASPLTPAESTLTRRISKLFLEPKSNEEILELGKGKLIDEVAFKIAYKDTTCFCMLKKGKVNFKKLQSIVRKAFFVDDLTIRYMDADGDYIPITSNSELQQCVEKSGGLTVKLVLTSEISVISKGNTDNDETQKLLGDIERRLRKQYPKEEFLRESFVISDPSRPDNPLIYVNDGFEKLTLYPSEEIVGKNCRFLQGKLSNLSDINRLSKGIKEGKDVSVELVNYRKDGKPFWNRFRVFPLRDDNNKITHFVAVQQDITHIKQRARNPREWTPADVSEWLRFMRISNECADTFEQQAVDGKQLVALAPEDFARLKVEEKETERIKELIKHLVSTSTPASKISVKAYFEGEALIVRVKPTISLKAFQKKIEKKLKIRNLPTVVQYVNAEKEKIAFVHTKELTQQLLQARLRGESFKVYVDFFDLYLMK